MAKYGNRKTMTSDGILHDSRKEAVRWMELNMLLHETHEMEDQKMMENHKPTQNERIIRYMETFGSITQVEALQDLGVMRLASRISDLRKRGHNIVSEVEEVNNRYGETCHIKRYKLVEGEA